MVVGPCQGLPPSVLPLVKPFPRLHYIEWGGTGSLARKVGKLGPEEDKERREGRRDETRDRVRKFSLTTTMLHCLRQGKPAAAQPCWIPFAAVDQNYKAERSSERPLGLLLSVPRIFFLHFTLFSLSRRKREQGRFENATKIDRFVCPLFFDRLANESANLLQARVSSQPWLPCEQPFIG